MNLKNVEPVNHSGKTNSWYTPRWILDSFDDFDLDPCGDKRWDTAKKIYEEKDDGLTLPWFGRVWMNPPYGKHTKTWLNKFVNHGNGICLVFARTDTLWFQDYANKMDWLLFVKGRIRFVNSETLDIADRNPGAPSVLMGIDCDPPSIEGILLNNIEKIHGES